MSDTPQGEGWWQASDGKWYAPQAQAGQPQAAPFQSGYQPPMQPSFQPQQETNSTATMSLVLGLVGFVVCGLFTGIPAIITGIKARKEIRESGGAQGGDGLALGGIITGALATAWSIVAVVAIIAVSMLGTAATSRFEPVGGINSDSPDGYCDVDRFMQDPDC